MTRQNPRRPGAPGARSSHEPEAGVDELATEADERFADAIIREVGALAREDIDPDDPVQARYWAWAAAEARAALTSDERRALAARAEAFAARLVRERPGTARARHGTEVIARAGTPEERAPLAAATAVAGRAAVALGAAHACVPQVALAVAAGQGRELWDEPVDRWLALPDDVPRGEYVALSVSGDSMTPMLHAGDTILVRVGVEARVGDVVVARRPEQGYVVKRVSHLTEEEMTLSSLNAAYDDIAVPRAPRLVVGTVVLRWCAHGDAARAPTAG